MLYKWIANPSQPRSLVVPPTLRHGRVQPIGATPVSEEEKLLLFCNRLFKNVRHWRLIGYVVTMNHSTNILRQRIEIQKNGFCNFLVYEVCDTSQILKCGLFTHEYCHTAD